LLLRTSYFEAEKSQNPNIAANENATHNCNPEDSNCALIVTNIRSCAIIHPRKPRTQ